MNSLSLEMFSPSSCSRRPCTCAAESLCRGVRPRGLPTMNPAHAWSLSHGPSAGWQQGGSRVAAPCRIIHIGSGDSMAVALGGHTASASCAAEQAHRMLTRQRLSPRCAATSVGICTGVHSLSVSHAAEISGRWTVLPAVHSPASADVASCQCIGTIICAAEVRAARQCLHASPQCPPHATCNPCSDCIAAAAAAASRPPSFTSMQQSSCSRLCLCVSTASE